MNEINRNKTSCKSYFFPDLIVNFGGRKDQTLHLAKRLRYNCGDPEYRIPILQPEGTQLRTAPTDQEEAIYAGVKGDSRIYILDHSCPNSEFLSGKHYTALGDYFAARVNHAAMEQSRGIVTFSLIACHSSYAQAQGKRSFAAQFHRYLGLKYAWQTRV